MSRNRTKSRLTHLIVVAAAVIISALPFLTVTPSPSLAVQSTQSLGDDIRRQNQTPTVTTLLTQTPVAQTTPSTGALILLNPFSGPSASPITITGQRWTPDSRVIIYLPFQGQEYAVASTLVTEDGTFTVSIFLPIFLTDQPLVPIIARTLTDDETARAFYTVSDAVPEPAATPVSTSPQGIITTDALNVRSGPGTEYGAIGLLQRDQEVSINGQAGGWW
ncbi:MAG: SH3 domain-containing protein, partial [Anaerolineae bacterium]|nr:SH3 domain-containing protein [Anaerolineae bacterium]